MKNVRLVIASHRNKAHYYHYMCYASGSVCVIDKWGDKPTMQCRDYDGDFNCGHRGCRSATIKGTLELTPRETIENNLIDELLQALKIEKEGK